MVKSYENGALFVEENGALLDTNKYQSAFFRLDAPMLKNPDNKNYAFQVKQEDKVTVAMKVEPFDLMIFGDNACLPELFAYIKENGLEFTCFLCAKETGDYAVEVLRKNYGAEYYEGLAMDFMECSRYTEPSSPEVIAAVEEDLDQICECLRYFIDDCGLMDKVNRELTRQSIASFRIIKEDGRIVSMAKVSDSTDTDRRIADVYTVPDRRGCGLARKVVNTAKNETLELGKIATLNVDRNNPVTNHLYRSLGFEVIFPQGQYWPR